MKLPLLHRGLFTCLFLTFTGGLLAETAPASSAVSVSLVPAEAGPAISKELTGAQSNFFDSSTKALIASPSLINSWKDLSISVLRYPGGTWADHYLWDAPERSYYAVGNAKSVVTPEEFVTNCRAVGAEPIFQVNTNMKEGDGVFINPTKLEDIQEGAQRAARWVREANKRKHWNVKYWEIGNEVWIWLHPEEYATYVVEYAKAMRAIDPTIKIIACGLSGTTSVFNANWLKFPDDPTWVPRTNIQNNAQDWNQALFDKAAGSFDYVAPHLYIDSPDKPMSAADRFAATNEIVWQSKDLNAQVEWGKKLAGQASLAVTEWGCNFHYSVPVLKSTEHLEDGNRYYYYSLANGLNNALYLGKMIQASPYVQMAVLHSLDDVTTWWYWPANKLGKTPILHPTALGLKVWGKHLGTRAMQVHAENLPQGSAYADGQAGDPLLFLYGSEDDSHVYFVAINLDPNNEQDVTLAKSSGWSDTPAGTMWLTGKELSSTNFASFDGASAPEVTVSTSLTPLAGGNWNIKMPAHSMVGLTILKQSTQQTAQ